MACSISKESCLRDAAREWSISSSNRTWLPIRRWRSNAPRTSCGTSDRTPTWRSTMVAESFQPKTMQLSILTAALQELTPRDERDADPDLAIEEWLAFARRLNCPNIQLSAALHPSH